MYLGRIRSVRDISRDDRARIATCSLRTPTDILMTKYSIDEAGRPVNLPSVLKHELRPVPVSLAEMNGTLRTGNNSELANLVREDTDWPLCPETIQLYATSSFLIIDGQCIAVALGKPDAAVTFGDLVETYMKTVRTAGSEYHRIDVVFGRYRDETIKGTTINRRRTAARPIRRLVEGRDVPLPKNWSIFRRSITFLV